MKKSLICGVILIILSILTDAYASYRSTLAKWTKYGRVYTMENVEARVMWHATLLSYEMTDAQKGLLEKRRLDPNLIEGKEGISFFVSLYTPKELNDFSLDKGSTWKVFLVGKDGKEIGAETIERVTLTPTEKAFYPYLNRWDKTYRIGFPTIDLGRNPRLVLRSIMAESALQWKIKE